MMGPFKLRVELQQFVYLLAAACAAMGCTYGDDIQLIVPSSGLLVGSPNGIEIQVGVPVGPTDKAVQLYATRGWFERIGGDTAVTVKPDHLGVARTTWFAPGSSGPVDFVASIDGSSSRIRRVIEAVPDMVFLGLNDSTDPVSVGEDMMAGHPLRVVVDARWAGQICTVYVDTGGLYNPRVSPRVSMQSIEAKIAPSGILELRYLPPATEVPAAWIGARVLDTDAGVVFHVNK